MASFDAKTISHIHHELHSHLPSEPALRTKALESLLGLIVWWLVTLAAGALSLLFGGLALIFVFWDTHRVLVAVLITSVFVLMTLVAGSIVLAKLRQQRSLFATTLTELAKDRAFLKAPP